MCGIAGVITSHGSVDRARAVAAMTAAMRHRGPDDTGQLDAEGVSLGIRRLSIIDLAGGRQPVANEDGSVAVVSNGEIYNFVALRDELEELGHRFRTKSDTETIVHAYEAWGIGCVERLRGMFAFALHDRGGAGRPARVLLARDRFGIKPLYYAPTRDGLLFASEVRALLASGLVARRLAADALAGYLLFGSVQEPNSIVEGIVALEPAHLLDVRLDGSSSRPTPYWRFPTASPAAPVVADTPRVSAAGTVRAVLADSVRHHLVADVPVGIFLSGGLDSAVIAALARCEVSDVSTVTIAFPEARYSEGLAARRLARHLGTTHHEVTITADAAARGAVAAVGALDQPSMDGVNTWLVSRAARHAGLTVALSGLGGDEIFGGYATFRWTPWLARVRAAAGATPRAWRRPAAAFAGGIAARLGRPDPGRKLAALIAEPEALPHPFFAARLLFSPAAVARLRGGAAALRETPAWRRLGDLGVAATDTHARVADLECGSYMLNTLLRDTDALSMAHSLEVRVPFLDHHVVDTVFALPAAVRGQARKRLLADAFADALPAGWARGPKRTFTLPWDVWLRTTLAADVERGLRDLPPSLADALDAGCVGRVWDDFARHRTGWSRPWSLYVLSEWMRRHVDGG
jgi:asparagine synthase (glutamine-hydrolysing)